MQKLPLKHKAAMTWAIGFIKSELLIRIFLLISIIMGYGSKACGQYPDTMTIQIAIDLAKNYHPTLKSAALKIEKQKKLQKTAFDIGKTKFSFAGGQLHSGLFDYQIQVSQEFKIPGVYKAQSRLQAEKIALSESEFALSELELEFRVRQSWGLLAFGDARLKLFNELLDYYENFAAVAQKQYSAGEINALEKISAESRFQEIIVRRIEAESNVMIYRQNLNQWIGADADYLLPRNALMLRAEADISAENWENNPFLNYYGQFARVAEEQIELQKKGNLPDLNLGYMNQQMEGIGGFHAFQIGIAAPLFFGAQKARVEAAVIDREIAKSEYESQSIDLSNMYQTKEYEYQKYEAKILWFETQGIVTADELLRFAGEAYEKGEIDYIEWVNTVEQAVNIKLEYLEVLSRIYQLSNDLNYIIGEW